VAAYHHLLHEHPDPEVRIAAARDWCAWEAAVVSLEEGYTPDPRYADPAFRMTFARIVTHYFHHAAWLEDTELLRNASRLAPIPGVIVHGRFDLSGPPDAAWQLARAWPGAELHLVRTGHVGGDEMLARDRGHGPVRAVTAAHAYPIEILHLLVSPTLIARRSA
jgi:proline iminopeptidase